MSNHDLPKNQYVHSSRNKYTACSQQLHDEQNFRKRCECWRSFPGKDSFPRYSYSVVESTVYALQRRHEPGRSEQPTGWSGSSGCISCLAHRQEVNDDAARRSPVVFSEKTVCRRLFVLLNKDYLKALSREASPFP